MKFLDKSIMNSWAFGVGAAVYDRLTHQDIWRAQIRKLLNHVPQGDDPLRVLDVGCGPGISAFVLAESLPAGSTVVGVDLSAQMIARAQQHLEVHHAHLSNIEFAEADATQLPFDDDAFDLVTGHSFLYLLPDPVAVLRDVHRVLTSDGRAVFMEPNRDGSLRLAGLNGLRQTKVIRQNPSGATRFGMSMLLWRSFSAIAGRMSLERATDLFGQAGFDTVEAHPTLSGLGLHCVGFNQS